MAVVYGQPGGWPIPTDAVALADASTSFVGNAANAELGAVVAAAGDANGDGLSDYWVGDAAHNQAYLVYGQINSANQDFDPSSLTQSLQYGSVGKVYSATTGAVGDWLGQRGTSTATGTTTSWWASPASAVWSTW